MRTAINVPTSSPTRGAPEGLTVIPGFVVADEGDELMATIRHTEAERWRRPRMRGLFARRRVVCYGWDYLYIPSIAGLAPAPPMPP